MTTKGNTGRLSTGTTSSENRGYQPQRGSGSQGTGSVQGGYQGPTSHSTPSNPPSGGSSGGKK